MLVDEVPEAAAFGHEHLDAVTPAPPARVADRERREANVARLIALAEHGSL